MRKILLVEDHKLNREMLSRRLELRGYEVIAAENGRVGVDMASEHQPDLVIMDLSLPVLDGWEATRLLKSSERTEHIPVLALTANMVEENRERALSIGCDAFDTKPVEIVRLISTIERLLGAEAL